MNIDVILIFYWLALKAHCWCPWIFFYFYFLTFISPKYTSSPLVEVRYLTLCEHAHCAFIIMNFTIFFALISYSHCTGPMLSSGMCTEVFQFDILAASPGSVIPATSAKNISAVNPKNLNKGKNRRILHNLPPIPLPGSTHNITKERVGKENSHGKNNSLSASSMVVSVLVDPRETSNNEGGEGILGKNSLSRVFVVLLLDGVKYVTYSCVIPLMGSTTHLVSTWGGLIYWNCTWRNI